MIEAVQEWLRAVVVTALLLSVVQTLLPEGNVRRIASFSGGLILMLVLLRPLLGTDLSALELDLAPYREAIEERQAELEAESDQELEQLIAERTGAYILEEAARLGMQIQVRVETAPGDDGMPVPVRVEITGAYSAQLSEWIARALGIPGEEQVWHEENLED